MDNQVKSDTFSKQNSSSSWVWDYREYVKNICLKTLCEYPQEAEDIAQNVLLKACQTPSLPTVQKRGGWIRRMAINECMNYFRGLNRVPKLAGRKPRRRGKLAPETYAGLPEDLREGIETSLNMIASLYRVKDILRRHFGYGRALLKAVEAIENAQGALRFSANYFPGGRLARRPAPTEKDLLRFIYLRDCTGPLVFGTPEVDRASDAILDEMRGFNERFGEQEFAAAVNLYEARRELSFAILKPGDLELIPGENLGLDETWGPFLLEIWRMKVSPLNLMYKVWSKAPGFRAGGSGKYLSRRRMGLVLKHHKIESKGSFRESLFSSIKNITMTENPKTAFERFRKAGYGQALKEKYQPIVKLIYRESFGKKTPSYPVSDFVNSKGN